MAWPLSLICLPLLLRSVSALSRAQKSPRRAGFEIVYLETDLSVWRQHSRIREFLDSIVASNFPMGLENRVQSHAIKFLLRNYDTPLPTTGDLVQ